jgi:hypothetical protein
MLYVHSDADPTADLRFRLDYRQASNLEDEVLQIRTDFVIP